MTKSTGPIVAAGALTWANQVVFAPDREPDVLKTTVSIGVSTAVLAVGLGFIEKGSESVAAALAYSALITVLFVRIMGKPTPLERLMTTLRT